MSLTVSSKYKEVRARLKNGQFLLVEMIKNTKGPQYSHYGEPLFVYSTFDQAVEVGERLQKQIGGVIRVIEARIHYEGTTKERRYYHTARIIDSEVRGHSRMTKKEHQAFGL